MALAPEHVRGIVTGMHDSAITLGAGLGTPLAGLLVDVSSPAVTVLAVGSTGAVVAGITARVAGGGAAPRWSCGG
jgi:predicted MFS family arabinose efflux permease